MERGASVRAVITAMAIRNGFVSLKGAQPNPDGKLAILLCDRNVCHSKRATGPGVSSVTSRETSCL